MADLIIGGETFRVEVEGDPIRPPLLLSHSLGVDLSMWDPQMPALTRHFRVVRYDTRGHGGTGLGPRPVSIATMGRDALAILDALEIESVRFLGLSMGGAVGFWLLAHAPERIERAVLANTAPRLGTPDSWNARITSVLRDGMAETARATIERWFSPSFAGTHGGQVDAIHARLRATNPEGYAACCAALRDMDLRATLPAIPHDVLILSGRDDPVVPVAEAAATAAQMPGGRHAILEARHLSNVEASDAFDTAVTSFLTARARPRPASRKPAASRHPAGKTSTRSKMAPAKRAAVSRRATAARAPLKETVRTPVKKAPTAKPGAKRRAAKTHVGRSAPARTATKLPTKTVKAAPKKASPKGAVKRTASKTTTRRPAPLLRARAPIARTTAGKSTAGKPTGGKGPSVKATAKGRSKAPSKTTVTAKTAKKPSRKAPAPRRKPAGKPRRPTGRRPT